MGGMLDIREAHRLQGNEEPESEMRERESLQNPENPDKKQNRGEC